MIYRACYLGTWYSSCRYIALCMFLAQLGARSFVPVFVQSVDEDRDTPSEELTNNKNQTNGNN